MHSGGESIKSETSELEIYRDGKKTAGGNALKTETFLIGIVDELRKKIVGG